MNKKFKAFLTCLALTTTIGVFSACGFLSATTGTPNSSSNSSVEESSSSEKESSSSNKTKKYKVTFKADGETVDSVAYKEGDESIEEPDVPAKEGYEGKWEEYELDGNVTVNAIYTAIEYKVIFKADGETVEEVVYTVEDDEITEPEVPAKDHYTGEWEAYELNGDSVTVNAVYTAIEYKVTFVVDGETVGEDTYTLDDKEITVPDVPEKEDYTGAWEAYELNGGNVTVNAVYTAMEYTVTFVADGATVTTETYTVEDTEITVPEVPGKDHYTGAWEAYELDGGNKTVNAVYTAVEYTVTFVADGVTVEEVSYTVENQAIAEPNVPKKEGFGGKWEAYELNGGNKTVNAVYTAGVYTVTFKADGLTVATVDYTVENTEITEPTFPEKDHYTGAWEAYELTIGDVTVNAVYTAIEYTITFVANGETVGTETYTVEDTEVTEPAIPEKAYYENGAWEAYELDGGNKTVNAVYTAIEYTVTFVADGETVGTETYTVEDTEITVPAVPAKEHYLGVWEEYTLDNGNKTVNAVYTAAAYTVTFVFEGETIAAETYTIENTEITEPAIPEKAHYVGAWEAYELNGGDKTVNGSYTAIEYTVSFVVGGETVATETYTVEDTAINLPEVPEQEGYSGGEWAAFELDGGDKVVELINFTANTYKITYNANGGTATATELEVTYGSEYTLATATAPKSYQEFLGWADEEGNMVTAAVWNIASDVTLTAVYSEGIVFETLTEVPSYMSIADETESISIVELEGNKVLEIKLKEGKNAPALKVTTDFLTTFFADESVDYIAFDAKAATTTVNNFRRVTLRSNGKFEADCYEHDMTYTHDSDGDGVAETYATTGIRADSWKTFYFSRADYEAWLAQGVTSERFIAGGQFNPGDSVYVDNIRPVTAAERKAGVGSLESGGVRINDAGKTLLFYMLDKGTTWQFNMQVSSGVFTNVGYTNEDVSDGIRALQFTKPAGTLAFNFTSGREFYDELITATGYYALDIYIPEGSDATIAYHTTSWAGVTVKAGAWTTIYVNTNNKVEVKDTTGGTYKVDNIRSITEAEYNLAALDFEANVSGLRTKELGDDTTNKGVCYYYGGADHTANTFSFAIAEGDGENDVATLKDVRLSSEYAHSGTYSLAIDKGAGYMYLTMRNDSTAYELLKDGFTFWIYSTTSINGVDAKNFINGCNEKFNDGEGVMIPANTWVQITVTAADMNPTRFLILQGSTEGTIYIDDFQPLPAE